MAKFKGFGFEEVHRFLESLFQNDWHAKRVYSLANATLGVMAGASLAIHVIGQSLAQARGLLTKHSVKQVDRLLSNRKVDVWESFHYWVPQVIGKREEVLVAMDWTEFDKDRHSSIVLSLVTNHGRTTPLIWLTVSRGELKGRRNEYEDKVLARLAEVLPAGVKVTILADACERSEEIDESRAQQAVERAQQRIAGQESELEMERALGAMRRAQVRLNVVRRRRARGGAISPGAGSSA